MKPIIAYQLDAIFIDDACSPLVKNAGSDLLSSLLTSLKTYTESHIDKEDPIRSVSDILVPGIFVALGHPWLALLVKILESYFGFSPGRVLERAWSSLVDTAKSGHITSQEVDAATEAAVSSETPSDSDVVPAANLQRFQNSEIRSFKLIAAGYPISITKYAAAKAVAVSLLGKLVGWTIKGVLAAAGIMVAGDIFNRITGHQDAKPTASGWPSFHLTEAPEVPLSTQTILKPSKGYTEEQYNTTSVWIEPTPMSNISDKIVRWATDIYPDLKGHEDLIRSSSNFAKVISEIQKYNATNNPTNNYVFIPRAFSSRKSVVDFFIDEVAAKYASLPKTPPNKQDNPASI